MCKYLICQKVFKKKCIKNSLRRIQNVQINGFRPGEFELHKANNLLINSILHSPANGFMKFVAYLLGAI